MAIIIKCYLLIDINQYNYNIKIRNSCHFILEDVCKEKAILFKKGTIKDGKVKEKIILRWENSN